MHASEVNCFKEAFQQSLLYRYEIHCFDRGIKIIDILHLDCFENAVQHSGLVFMKVAIPVWVRVRFNLLKFHDEMLCCFV